MYDADDGKLRLPFIDVKGKEETQTPPKSRLKPLIKAPAYADGLIAPNYSPIHSGFGVQSCIGSGKFNCNGLANQLRLLEKISEQTAGNVPKGGCCNKSLSYSVITIAEGWGGRSCNIAAKNTCLSVEFDVRQLYPYVQASQLRTNGTNLPGL
jgi:hypothetical protein